MGTPVTRKPRRTCLAGGSFPHERGCWDSGVRGPGRTAGPWRSLGDQGPFRLLGAWRLARCRSSELRKGDLGALCHCEQEGATLSGLQNVLSTSCDMHASSGMRGRAFHPAQASPARRPGQVAFPPSDVLPLHTGWGRGGHTGTCFARWDKGSDLLT